MENGGPNLYELYLGPKAQKLPLAKLESTTKKLLEALAFLHRRHIGHFDIYPDNCTEEMLIDFGKSESVSKGPLEKIKFNLFYLPPEYLLGIPFGLETDIFCLGIVLFEIFTKKQFSNAESDLEVLHEYLIRCNTKNIPEWMVQSSSKKHYFFENDILKSVQIPPIQPFHVDLIPENPPEQFNHFVDLLGRMLQFDPKQRITAQDALKHPFFTSEHSTDIAFHLDINHPQNLTLKISDTRNCLLKTIDLSTWHPGKCYHVPKLSKVRIQLFKESSPLIEREEEIADHQTLAFNSLDPYATEIWAQENSILSAPAPAGVPKSAPVREVLKTS